MIYGFVNGQTLMLRQPKIASDTIDYLSVQVTFSQEWEGADKWMHFVRGNESYEVKLVNDQISPEEHLMLPVGEWCVCIHGTKKLPSGLQRITTTSQTLTVEQTCFEPGEPFPNIPPSAIEQLEKEINELSVNSKNSVLYVEQNLTNEQQMQATKNIGAARKEDLNKKAELTLIRRW